MSDEVQVGPLHPPWLAPSRGEELVKGKTSCDVKLYYFSGRFSVVKSPVFCSFPDIVIFHRSLTPLS